MCSQPIGAEHPVDDRAFADHAAIEQYVRVCVCVCVCVYKLNTDRQRCSVLHQRSDGNKKVPQELLSPEKAEKIKTDRKM